jgi:Na+/H+-translocating membrane pyrophosphatase
MEHTTTVPMVNSLIAQKQLVWPALVATLLPCLECIQKVKVCFKGAILGIIVRGIFNAMSAPTERTQRNPTR